MSMIGAKIWDLDLNHDLGLSYPEFDHVKKQLETVKASFQTDDEWLAAISSGMMAFRHDALAQDAEDHASGPPECLVCGKETIAASLDSHTKVWYCKTHRVVIPSVKSQS